MASDPAGVCAWRGAAIRHHDSLGHRVARPVSSPRASRAGQRPVSRGLQRSQSRWGAPPARCAPWMRRRPASSGIRRRATYLWNRAAIDLAAGVRRRACRTMRGCWRRLNLAIADALIACWDAKYFFEFWRPITAIQLDDPTWTPLFATPAHPEYTSGHSTASSAAATVLVDYFGDDTPFMLESPGRPGLDSVLSEFFRGAGRGRRCPRLCRHSLPDRLRRWPARRRRSRRLYPGKPRWAASTEKDE